MKRIQTVLLSLLLTLCLLSVPFGGVGVSAEESAAPFDLIPTADDGYTIVEGDGTVTIADGVMTVVNNGDGDFRLTIDNTAPFDLSVLNTLHMAFNAEMPFKMAYHIISAADDSNDWLNTSTDYADVFEIDLLADRAAAGEYDVEMNLSDYAVAITDKSSVYFEQFIILITGKGTFTLNTAEVIAVESDEPTVDEPANDDTAVGDDAAAEEEPTDDVTTTTKATASQKDDADDAPNAAWLPIVIAVAVVVIVGAVVVVIVKRRKA